MEKKQLGKSSTPIYDKIFLDLGRFYFVALLFSMFAFYHMFQDVCPSMTHFRQEKEEKRKEENGIFPLPLLSRHFWKLYAVCLHL